MIGRLFLLLVGHALADFALQGELMAKGKNRHIPSQAPPGVPPRPVWWYWLTAHALIHGGAVFLVTGNVYLGIAETACHWAIDFGKCDGYYNVEADQGLHVACKLLWWGFA